MSFLFIISLALYDASPFIVLNVSFPFRGFNLNFLTLLNLQNLCLDLSHLQCQADWRCPNDVPSKVVARFVCSLLRGNTLSQLGTCYLSSTGSRQTMTNNKHAENDRLLLRRQPLDHCVNIVLRAPNSFWFSSLLLLFRFPLRPSSYMPSLVV